MYVWIISFTRFQVCWLHSLTIELFLFILFIFSVFTLNSDHAINFDDQCIYGNRYTLKSKSCQDQ